MKGIADSNAFGNAGAKASTTQVRSTITTLANASLIGSSAACGGFHRLLRRQASELQYHNVFGWGSCSDSTSWNSGLM